MYFAAQHPIVERTTCVHCVAFVPFPGPHMQGRCTVYLDVVNVEARESCEWFKPCGVYVQNGIQPMGELARPAPGRPEGDRGATAAATPPTVITGEPRKYIPLWLVKVGS